MSGATESRVDASSETPILKRLLLCFALVPVLALLASSAEGVPARCSLVPGFHPSTENGGAVLIATPTPDTVRAGPGTMRLGQGGGHSGNGRRDVIYGQRFQVFRSTEERDGIVDPVAQAVLVPWDYDASCEPVPWTRSAHWLRATDTLLVRGSRRDTAHWAGGLPTYDVWMVPNAIYAGRWWQANTRLGPVADTTVPVNTPEELFETLLRLPRSADVLTGEEGVLDGIHTWAFEHPGIAAHDPSAQMIAGVRRRVRVSRLMNQSVPFVGTWELQIRLRSGREIAYWLRTDERSRVPKGYDPEGPWGFNVLFNIAPSREELPTVYQHGNGWGMDVASRGPEQERHWRFSIELEEFRSVPALHAEIEALSAERVRTWRERWSAGEREKLRGEITLTDDGGALLRIAWDTDEDGKDDLVVTGRRVSRVTLVEPPGRGDYQRW